MAKNKRQRKSFITEGTEGLKYVIDGIEHQSKALVPIQIDAGNLVEIVQVDYQKERLYTIIWYIQ